MTQPQQLLTLKEIRPHGTKSFPCAIYQTRSSKKGMLVSHHWHDEAEILYFSGEKFLLEINMEQFQVFSECFYFINPGELHSITAEQSGSCGEDAVVFHPDILSSDSLDAVQMQLIRPIRNKNLLFPRCLTPEHPAFAAVREAFQTIFHSFGLKLNEDSPSECGAVTDDLTSQLYIKSSLLGILAALSSFHLFTPAEKYYDKRVERIKATLAYIKENYQEKIYIKDLAEQVNMNEQYFCRFFKKALGSSPMEYINKYRIRQSIHLLEETSLSVMEICLECGFNNLGNFLREFKKHTAATPLQYRRHFLSGRDADH